MTTSQYLARMSELGLSRGALAEGFPTGPTSKAWDTEPPDRRDARRKPKPPPITDDVSHLICKRPIKLKWAQVSHRVRSDLKPLYEMLYERGMPPSVIAEKTGIHPSLVHSTLRGEKIFHREKIRALLTEEERKELNWK